MAAGTCDECGSTLATDGTCPNEDNHEEPESTPAPAKPAAKPAAPAVGAAAKPVPPAQKWMNQFKK